jgi:hypothetical protein
VRLGVTGTTGGTNAADNMHAATTPKDELFRPITRARLSAKVPPNSPKGGQIENEDCRRGEQQTAS